MRGSRWPAGADSTDRRPGPRPRPPNDCGPSCGGSRWWRRSPARSATRIAA